MKTEYNPNAKIGRKFGNGIDWYPNLHSAIINRNIHRMGIGNPAIDVLELSKYAKRVAVRYNRMCRLANKSLNLT